MTSKISYKSSLFLYIMIIFLFQVNQTFTWSQQGIPKNIKDQIQEQEILNEDFSQFQKINIQDLKKTIYMKVNFQTLTFQIYDFDAKTIYEKSYTNETMNQILSGMDIRKGFKFLKQASWQKRTVALLDERTIKMSCKILYTQIDICPKIKLTAKKNISGSIFKDLYDAMEMKHQQYYNAFKECQKIHKINTYKNQPFYFTHDLLSSANYRYIYQDSKIEKINGDSWQQLVNVKALPKSGKIRFSFQVVFTKQKFLVIGIITGKSVNQTSSYQSKNSLNYLYLTGQNHKNGKKINNQGKILDKNKKVIVSMEIDMNQQEVTWFIENQRQSTLDFPREFNGKNLYSYLELHHQGDKIRILIPQLQQKQKEKGLILSNDIQFQYENEQIENSVEQQQQNQNKIDDDNDEANQEIIEQNIPNEQNIENQNPFSQ